MNTYLVTLKSGLSGEFVAINANDLYGKLGSGHYRIMENRSYGEYEVPTPEYFESIELISGDDIT